MNKKKKTLITVILVIVSLLLLFLVANSIAKSSARSKLIGKTFEGTYEYNCRYFDSTLDIRVEIIDENYCNVFFNGEKDYSDKTEDISWQEECQRIPYKLSGGIFGVKFEWIGAPDYPAKPFTVEMKNGEIKALYTSDYDSGKSAWLRVKP